MNVASEPINGKRLSSEPCARCGQHLVEKWSHCPMCGKGREQVDPPDPFEGLVHTIPESFLLSAPPSRKWLLRRDGVGAIPLGKVGFTIGSGGVGKTIAECGKALCVASGAPWLGFEVDNRGAVVLGLAEETEDEIHRRLYNAGRCMGLTQQQQQHAIRNIIAMPLAGRNVALTHGDGRGNVDVSPLRDKLMAHLRATGMEYSLVILDPLSRWGGNDIETDNHAATRFVEVLEEFTELPGKPTVEVAHHKSKVGRRGSTGDVSDARGSTAITDGARWAVNLEADGPRMVVLSLSKSNYAPPLDPVIAIRDKRWGGALRLPTDEELAAYETEKADAGKAHVTDEDIERRILDAVQANPNLRNATQVAGVVRGTKGRVLTTVKGMLATGRLAREDERFVIVEGANP